jgi:hypothetical protein
MKRTFLAFLILSIAVFTTGISFDRPNCHLSPSFNDDERSHMFEDAFEPLQIPFEINGYVVPAIIDTGAQVTVMSAACARRCRVSNLVDSRMAGKAVGIGSSDIVGCIGHLPMRVGPISYHSKVAILRDSRVDLIIGLDFLKRFKCDVIIDEGILRLRVRDKVIRLPFMKNCARDHFLDQSNFQGQNDRTGSYDSDTSNELKRRHRLPVNGLGDMEDDSDISEYDTVTHEADVSMEGV